MSYTVPYSFVPGTKARAQEVNANFASILESFDDIDANKVNLDLSNISSDGINVIKNNSSIRNIGELIFSPIPLTDSNLHLLDGSLISGNGIYREFVNCMRQKFNTNSQYNSTLFTINGAPQITSDGIASGFTNNDYLLINSNTNLGNDFELYLPFTCCQNSGASEIYRIQNGSAFVALLNQSANGSVVFNMTDGTNSLGTPVVIQNSDLTADENYIIVIKQSNQTCTYGYIHNGVYTQTGQKTNYPLNIPQFTRMKIGGGAINAYGGSIDLKSISIIVSGSEIISGKINCNYFTDETTWQNSVATYGECGKFVYNAGSNTVRLPKIKGLVEYTTSEAEIGNLTEAGLPNITGYYKDNSGRIGNYTSNSGALSYKTATTSNFGDGANSSSHVTEINFDASRSSAIYGNSSTVQPQTIKYLIYIVVASTPKTDIQVDIDNIATDLNGKLDADFSNIQGTNLRNFNGQWVYKHSAINNNINLTTGKYDVDLSSYLPVDQNKYEVIVNIYASQNSSSTSAFLILSSNIISEAGTTVSYANLATNSNSSVQGMQTVFPVGTNKVLSYRIGGQSFDSLYIRLYGYRRIGTNS